MARKNETLALLGTLLITGGILGGGVWWASQQFPGFNRWIGGSSGPSSPAVNSGQPPSGSLNTGTLNSASPTSSQTRVNFAQLLTNAPSGQFKYGGSTSWAPLRSALEATLPNTAPIQLRYVNPAGQAPGSGTGIQMLMNDEIDFAQTSRPLTAAEKQQAQQRNLALKEVQVAIDGLAVAVHPQLDVKGLTIEQLAGIYTGKITNWQEVGGPNLPITPLSRPVNAGGTIELFVEAILKGQSFGSTVQMVGTTTEALRKVSATPGSLYFASAPEVVPQCQVKPIALATNPRASFVAPYQEPFVPSNRCSANQRNSLNTAAFQSGQYPLTRNLYVVIKQSGTSEQIGTAYANALLSNEGQQAIAESGFVRIR